MDTAHTDGEPPSCGSTIRANIGCTENSSIADRNSVPENTAENCGACREQK